MNKTLTFSQLIESKFNYLSLIFLFGIFFSGITFHLIPGETSAIAGAAGTIILFNKKIFTSLTLFIYLSILFLSSIFCYVFVQDNIYEIAKQFFAYFQILVVFYCTKFVHFEKLKFIVITFMLINIIVCLMQFFSIGSEPLQFLLEYLVPRATAAQLIDSGRGVSGITSEPSHLAMSIFIQAFLLLYIGHIKGHDYTYFSALYVLFGVLISSSGTGIFLFLIYLVPFFLKQIKLFLIGIVLLFLVPTYLPMPVRLSEILSYFGSISSDSIRDAFYLSGFRLPSVVSSYAYSFTNFTIGGVGSWFTRIIDAYDYLGIDYKSLGHFVYTGEWTPTKPTSLFANISLEFGVYGLIFSIVLMFKLIKNFRNVDVKFYPYYFVAIFAAYFLSTTGNPEFPVILALALAGNLKSLSEFKIL